MGVLTSELTILLSAAAAIGFIHTLLGPDHYLPFIAMSRIGRWSIRKTAGIAALCGVGHVLSSVFLGIIGIVLGISVTRLESVESFRGNLAAWALIAFGLVYFIWGLRQALRRRRHRHLHAHAGGGSHIHSHAHTAQHLHAHGEKTGGMTPWVLFTIFLFGPCEPLIPLLMYPAARESLAGLILVTCVFGTVTILTMLGVILSATSGLLRLPGDRFERFGHALAGATLCLCGCAIQFLGL